MSRLLLTTLMIAGIATSADAAIPRPDLRHVITTLEMRATPTFRHAIRAFEPSAFWWLHVEAFK